METLILWLALIFPVEPQANKEDIISCELGEVPEEGGCED